ncbi:hypothetical protein EmuJ_000922400 [Echinococcus multilocularis]|uniref:Uncharacterized protein n=1 Tax=Echinococcus multilocularis TaxID=6211 RepID=A0A068YGU0_ECHMU|nr:hypothetical protein EmuJ_000922400 [Echinococcus multilocularis]
MSVQPQSRPPNVDKLHTSSFDQDLLPLPPPLPPHRMSGRGNYQAFLQPENRPLLPPSMSITPSLSPPEDPPKTLSHPPHAIRRHPTPKPRNHHGDCKEGDRKKQALPEERSGWLNWNDVRGGTRPTLLTGSYLQGRTPHRTSEYPLKLSESVKGHCTSAEHLEGVLAMPLIQGETGVQKLYRSMTTLNYTTAESSSMHDLLMVGGNEDDSRVLRVPESWLPIVDGRARLVPVNTMTREAPNANIPDVTPRPTTQVDGKSQRIWQPLKFRQEGETTTNRFTSG